MKDLWGQAEWEGAGCGGQPAQLLCGVWAEAYFASKMFGFLLLWGAWHS